jgi:hypothetical protein|tara:strand:+ start:172 stop:489 length:318 start_codon:yes stop_codon:yes gene_type:complete
MNESDIPMDSISLTVSLDEDGSPTTVSTANISASLPESHKEFLLFVLKGLEFHVHVSPDGLASVGNLVDRVEDEEEGVFFEPSEELIDAIKDKKVIPINGSKKPH